MSDFEWITATLVGFAVAFMILLVIAWAITHRH